jgi:hypothetical protein
MNDKSFFWPEGSPEATLAQLLKRQEAAPSPGSRPSGSTYGSLPSGMTQLGRGIAHRVAATRQQRLEDQIQKIDPTGEIARALMRGRQ